jgi:hypothetical protein
MSTESLYILISEYSKWQDAYEEKDGPTETCSMDGFTLRASLSPAGSLLHGAAPSPRSLFRTEDANGLPAFMLFLGDEEKHIVQCGVWYRI